MKRRLNHIRRKHHSGTPAHHQDVAWMLRTIDELTKRLDRQNEELERVKTSAH